MRDIYKPSDTQFIKSCGNSLHSDWVIGYYVPSSLLNFAKICLGVRYSRAKNFKIGLRVTTITVFLTVTGNRQHHLLESQCIPAVTQPVTAAVGMHLQWKTNCRSTYISKLFIATIFQNICFLYHRQGLCRKLLPWYISTKVSLYSIVTGPHCALEISGSKPANPTIA